jgi:hypothetical protein
MIKTIRKWMIVTMLLIAAPGFTACAGDASQRVVGDATVFVNGARLSIENAEATAVLAYKEQQKAAIMSVSARGGTRQQAEAAVKKIRADWETVWDAFREARRAHAALHQILTAYDQGRAELTEIARLSSELANAHRILTEQIQKHRPMREEGQWENK